MKIHSALLLLAESSKHKSVKVFPLILIRRNGNKHTIVNVVVIVEVYRYQI